MVYGDGLENRCWCKPTVGSNPTPSANLASKQLTTAYYVKKLFLLKMGFANLLLTTC